MPSDATPSPSPSLSEHDSAILEHVPDAIWVVGPDGRINFANTAAAVLFGRPRAELLGAQAGTFLPGASSSRRTDPDPAPAGEPTTWQGHIQRPDGALLPAEFRAAPLHTGNPASGAEPPSLVIARDVSGWITEHQRVREESERLQLLVANAPDLIFTCDVEHRFVWTNLVAETLTGYSARRVPRHRPQRDGPQRGGGGRATRLARVRGAVRHRPGTHALLGPRDRAQAHR